MSKSLVELSKEYAFLHHELMASGGELTPIIEDHIQSFYNQLALKVDSISYVLDRLTSESEYWKEKATSYRKIAQGCIATRERISGMIKHSMQNMECTEIEGINERLRLTGGRFILVIDDEKLIPDAFKKQTVVTEIDENTLRDALKAGIKIEGAHLEEIKSLRILVNRNKE